MKKLLTVAALLVAGRSYALPPSVPAHFSGMAVVHSGADRACSGTAPFMFDQLASGEWRVLLTTPPCFKAPFKIRHLVQIQPTSLGTLWVITLRPGEDPGNDDGPLVHLMPGDPADQAAMVWGANEVSRFIIRGIRVDPTHYELRFRPVP